jgi:RimJ/RimL family protein N-acetyltransferase
MSYGFSELGMNELRLGVFDFNLPAIKCYINVGFTQSSFEPKAREIDGEKWDLIKMNKLKHG